MDVSPGPAKSAEPRTVTVLVTGANSGVGFGIACRIIDEFLFTRPQSQSLHLLFSTRDVKKSEATSKLLRAHLQKTLKEADGRLMGASLLLEKRVKIEGVLCDLTKLTTVKALAKDLLQRRQRLDAVIWNAGVGGWISMNWPKAVWSIMSNIVHSTIYVNYFNGTIGDVTKRQTDDSDEPPLGQTFAANTFGHYMLTHWLAPLLDSESRVIWVSSLGTCIFDDLALDDLQGLRTDRSYESSKRLTDLLALTSNLPSTRVYTNAFFSSKSEPNPDDPPKMYLTHPGICGTAISGINPILAAAMFAALLVARWVGSPWHPVDPYKGAVSACFVALAPADQLEGYEQREGKGKWGSAAGVFGDERVARTELEGWGFCGQVGVVPTGSVTDKKGRYKHMRATNQEMREDFEDQGCKVWQAMETLRMQWEERLGPVRIEDAEDL